MKRKKILSRLAFSLLLLAVGLELSLQAAHYLHRWRQGAPRLPHPEAPVILCVGDSHTYGVKLPAGLSYPGQLQALLDARGLPANVINAGVPGQSTSELRRLLPELLARHRPAAVVILSGANNEWNRHDTVWSDLQDGVAPPGLRASLQRAWYGPLSSLRTVRLATYLWSQLGKFRNIESSRDRDGNLHLHEWRGKGNYDPVPRVLDRTRRDLFNIIDTVRRAGAVPIVLTYAGQPFSPMGGANSILRQAALSRQTPLVDADAIIHPLFIRPDGSMDQAAHDRLFLADPKETHLAAPGYAVVARAVLSELLQTGVLEK